MASRADDGGLGSEGPAANTPGLFAAIRSTLSDAYYHSWRLLPANIVWTLVVLAYLTLVVAVPVAIVVAPLLAIPTAGIFRLTTRIVRGEAVSFSDALDAWRRDLVATVGVGAAVALAVAVFLFNIVAGLASASPLGWALATLAGWGLVATWLVAWTTWPILLDPSRSGRPVRDRLRLAGLLVLAHPVRIAALGVVLATFLIASTVAIVALAAISVSLSALLASRFVLPAADRLEARLGTAVVAPVGPETDPAE